MPGGGIRALPQALFQTRLERSEWPQVGPGRVEVGQYTSQKVTFGTTFLNALVTALKTAPTNPLINTAKVRLSNNPAFNPNPAETIATLAATECAYTGYAAGGIALVVGSPVNLSPICQGAVTTLQFLATTATPFVPDTSYGYWVDDGTNVILAEAFPVGFPFGFSAPGDFLELVLQIPAQAFQATS